MPLPPACLTTFGLIRGGLPRLVSRLKARGSEPLHVLPKPVQVVCIEFVVVVSFDQAPEAEVLG
jgi:hypothetical protein